jgi:O-antigen/teichoic acid export membrane protein
VACLGWGAEGSLLGTLFSSGAFAVVGVALLWPWLRFTWHGADVKAALLYSLPLIPHLAFFWVSNLSDRIILGHYRSEAEVGIYSLGYNVGMGMSLLVNAFASSWSPVFFSTMNEAEPDTQPAAARLGRTASHVVAGFTLAALAFALAAPELVQLMAYFAKPAYLKAAPIVPWVILGFWVQALYTTLVVVVYYYKRTGWLPLITGAGAAVNLALNLWLVPRYGMIAAAIDTVVAFAVSALLTWRLSSRLLHLHFERQRLVLIALSAIALYAVLMGIAWPGIGSGLGAKALIFAAYCAALSLAGLLPRGGLRRPVKL